MPTETPDFSFLGAPARLDSTDDLVRGIELAMRLDESPAFLEGLSARLTELGTPCTPADTNTMLAEVKRRYKAILGKSCPRTVREWIRGTTPGFTNRLNQYELCFALDLDCLQTAEFFRERFLTLPFHVKNRIDAVFLYALLRGRPYTVISGMLEQASGYVPQENAHTETAQITSAIRQIDDDAQFLRYLSAHCYGNEQQFQVARRLIDSELALVKQTILRYETERSLSPERLGSAVISELLGYRYQSRERTSQRLPKRFTQSLPNDVTLGKIVRGENASYELLRKTLILLRFYNFYSEAENTSPEIIDANLLDFYEELNTMLLSCGFAGLYARHPFDCLILYCANSYEPIVTLHSMNE